MMQNYRMTIQYDGTRYQGWQRQTSTGNTIQGKLEEILSKMCDKKVEIDGAGRTDAGVHSRGQTASFMIDTDKTPEEIRDYINRYLPEDIAVTRLTVAGNRFHARLNATGKHYRYRIRTSPLQDVFERRYVYHLGQTLDVDAMRKGAELLSGTHDFKAFTSNHRTKKSTVRSIRIEIKETPEELILEYTGDGFLYHMVRILTGTLVEIGQGERKPEEIPDIISSKERSRAGMLVPAQGLCLEEVWYE